MFHPKLEHLSNLGQMGKLIASYDWTSTTIGSPDHWPESLFTSLNIILESKIPMYIGWGENLVQFYNDAHIQILGNKHPAALGNIPDISWAETHDKFKPLLVEVFKGSSFHQENTPYEILINGTLCRRFFYLSCIPIRSADGHIGGVLVTAIDRTEEMESKNALEKSVTNFRNYQELSPIPFLSLTNDWIVDYINPAALKSAVKNKEEIVGHLFWEAFPGARESIFFKHYQKAMKGEQVELEGHFEPFDTWYKVFAYPLNPGIGFFSQDITESKKLQFELKSAIEARDRFLSLASHELNTPLTSLKLHTQIMERNLNKGIDETKLRKFFQQTDIQISRIGRLVDDMLDASRIRQGKLSLKFKDEDLKELISDSIERISPYFNDLGVSSPTLASIGIDFHCKVDGFRIDQVINNLLMNALKYGEERPVKVTIRDENTKIIIEVEDQGKGIAEAEKELVFEQFYRSKNQSVEGLGLGLFITKKIVNAHHGEIAVQSKLGEGTTFKIELPKVF